ncbi:ribose-5-phosphate isomerase RpiA [Jatrophihabitans endophyticus]|uniref:ribose-5-phosphate isomerase RpiA n=1 Tax=Jatrophihabitans endophyticus TaxID=1206085 RepID=UPI0019EDD6FB|nr:ribose-5-phosphate isomerase RpiA [Jatrophihabitans endophyticus]MBE7190446.1 ribose-5-phosphate isomerase RpiA [Jatrophihabitans endophyticus]
MSDDAEALKRQVGIEAATLVEDGMVVGLGTGSTARFMIDALAERARQGLRFVGVPTSKRSEEQARELGLDVSDLATHPEIDLTIDGADDIERGTLHLIKGLGGALLREKIVASASRRMVVIADASKVVDHLGQHSPIPVEVSSFGWEVTAARLADLGLRPAVRRDRAGTLFLTDGGNLILDCATEPLADPADTERRILGIVGVFECGLFIHRAELALVAESGGVRRLTRS